MVTAWRARAASSTIRRLPTAAGPGATSVTWRPAPPRAFAPAAPADVLLNIIYAVKAGYRQGASFVMNRRTQNEIRKIKNADGDYLWQPAAAAGAPASLLGFPIVEAEAMPSIAPDAFPLAFGDFRSFYLIVDRLGVRILRDPYSAKPYVLFYTTKRVGGGVQNFEAAKLLKIAA